MTSPDLKSERDNINLMGPDQEYREDVGAQIYEFEGYSVKQ